VIDEQDRIRSSAGQGRKRESEGGEVTSRTCGLHFRAGEKKRALLSIRTLTGKNLWTVVPSCLATSPRPIFSSSLTPLPSSNWGKRGGKRRLCEPEGDEPPSTRNGSVNIYTIMPSPSGPTASEGRRKRKISLKESKRLPVRHAMISPPPIITLIRSRRGGSRRRREGEGKGVCVRGRGGQRRPGTGPGR